MLLISEETPMLYKVIEDKVMDKLLGVTETEGDVISMVPQKDAEEARTVLLYISPTRMQPVQVLEVARGMADRLLIEMGMGNRPYSIPARGTF